MRIRQAITAPTLLAFCAALWIGSPPAAADTVEDARAAYAEGEQAFRAGDYVTAIKDWKRADQLKPAPALYYNVGLAYERLARFHAATKYYRMYLAAQPSAPNRGEVEDRIAACEAGGQPMPAGPASQSSVVPPSPGSAAAGAGAAEDLERVPDTAGSFAPAPPPGAATTPPPPPPGSPAAQAEPDDDTPAYSHWWFWAVAGGGLLVVLAASSHDSNHAPIAASVADRGLPLFSF